MQLCISQPVLKAVLTWRKLQAGGMLKAASLVTHDVNVIFNNGGDGVKLSARLKFTKIKQNFLSKTNNITSNLH